MKYLLGNFILAIIWLILTGNFTQTNFVFGFLFSYVILWVVARKLEDKQYFHKVPLFISFIFYFLYELVKANLRVAYDILTPQHHMNPGILAVQLEASSDLEITMLANVVTLTPGTLTLDVSSNKKVIYIHFMYIDNEENARQQIKDFEKRILNILR